MRTKEQARKSPEKGDVWSKRGCLDREIVDLFDLGGTMFVEYVLPCAFFTQQMKLKYFWAWAKDAVYHGKTNEQD